MPICTEKTYFRNDQRMNSTIRNFTRLPASRAYEPIWIWLTSMLMPLICIGNLLVIISFKSNRQLQTKTYIFLVSLAVSDLTVGVIAVPMWIDCMINTQECRQHQQLFKFLDLFGAFASISHLTIITVERYIAICRPYFHERLSSWFHKGTLIFIWTLSISMAGFSWYDFKTTEEKNIFNLSVAVLGFVLPVTIIISMYIGIFKVAKSLMKRQQRPHLVTEKDNRRRLRDDHKVAVTVAVICGFFIIAWLPFFVLSIIASYCLELCLQSQNFDLHRLIATVKLLHYGNSMVNPIVYAFRDREMRNTFLRILRIKVCWEKIKSTRRKQAFTYNQPNMTASLG